MHLSIQLSSFDDPLDDGLAFADDLGVGAVDLKTSGYYSPPDIDPAGYLGDERAQAELLDRIREHGLEIAVVGGGNNPLHPVEEHASTSDDELRQAIRLAAELGVDVVACHAGLPGGGPADRVPNWITTPLHTQDAYEYQWEEVAMPYWRDLAEFAADHAVDVAIECHLQSIVSSPVDLVRLRQATNDRIGAKVDPAHLHLQGIDECRAIRYLADEEALFHFEASDAAFDAANRALRGFNDPTPASRPVDRSWLFHPVGFGHGRTYWNRILRTLELVGYDGPLSVQVLRTVEPVRPGIERSVEFLDELLFAA